MNAHTWVLFGDATWVLIELFIWFAVLSIIYSVTTIEFRAWLKWRRKGRRRG